MANKFCSRCDEEKPGNEFHPSKTHRDGLRSWCKLCSRTYNAMYREINDTKVKERRKQYNLAYKTSGRSAQYQAKNKERIVKGKRNRHISSKYAITPEQYDTIYSGQDGQCAICLDKHNTLCIDHNHTTGKVRGLLCRKCNFLLSHAKENKEILFNAISYLKSYICR